MEFSLTPNAGTPIVFTATVKNQGTEATPLGTEVSVQFAVDGQVVSWETGNTSSIDPGGTNSLTANTGTTGNTWVATAGTHTVTAWVNYNSKFGETNTNNNKLTITITIPP